MSDSVVERVADRLEIQPEQTDQVLRTLAQLIKKQSARDGQVRVPGLGVFQQTTDTLVFEPEAALAEAVNGRYAGLESVPLTLSPEAETILDDAPAEAAEDEPAAEEAVAEEEPVVEDEPYTEAEEAEEDALEEPVAEEEAQTPGTVPLYDGPVEPADFDDPDVSEAAAYEESPERLGEVEEETEPDITPPVMGWSKEDLDVLLQESRTEDEEHDTDALLRDEEDVDEEAEALLDTLVEEGDTLPPPLPPGPQISPQEATPPRRRMLPWAILVVAVLIIGAALLYQFGFFGSSPADPTTPPIATETPPAETPTPAATDPQTQDPDTPPPTGETQTPPETPAETPPPETPAPTPPAAGQSIDPAQGGYTVVVASFARRAIAETEAERFRQQLNDPSTPVGVIQGDSRGRTWYRVAIGQVPTVEEAAALRARLASSLPEGTWVTPITSDS